MIPFKQYIAESNDHGIYVCVKFDQKSIKRIESLQGSLKVKGGEKIDPKSFHTTITYSKKSIEFEPDESLNESAKIVDVVDWIGHNKKRYIVALLESEYCVDRHKENIKNGAVHSFDEYIPHITLYKDIESYEKFKLPEHIPLAIIKEETESLQEEMRNL